MAKQVKDNIKEKLIKLMYSGITVKMCELLLFCIAFYDARIVFFWTASILGLYPGYFILVHII